MCKENPLRYRIEYISVQGGTNFFLPLNYLYMNTTAVLDIFKSSLHDLVQNTPLLAGIGHWTISTQTDTTSGFSATRVRYKCIDFLQFI